VERVALVAVLWLLAAQAEPPTAAFDPVRFERDIQPIFKAHCLRCHGAEKPKGHLRLDSRLLAMKGGVSGKVIVPGRSRESLLVRLLLEDDEAGAPESYRTFATNCLLARRLVERGVRFVNVVHASWDHHSNLDVELPYVAGMADRPVAALLRDLKQRGMLDEVLVLWLSEFGRTPLGENRPKFSTVSGRDHHPLAFSIWMAGGGIQGGRVYGQTDEIGWGGPIRGSARRRRMERGSGDREMPVDREMVCYHVFYLPISSHLPISFRFRSKVPTIWRCTPRLVSRRWCLKGPAPGT